MLTNIPLVCGFIFALVAVLQLVLPPKRINSLYGYRTARSMKSEAHWQFAQRYSVARTFEGAAFLLVLGVALLWYDASEKMLLVVGLIALLAVPVYLIWRTERALKNKFPS